MLTGTREAIVSQLEWRYATKKFDANKKIDNQTWALLERALILTPSSWGLQTWKFVVVTDQKLKEALVPASYKQEQVKNCSHLLVICRPNNLTAEDIIEFVEYSAQVQNIPITNLDVPKKMMLQMIQSMNSEQLSEWMIRQCYIALGNFMTTAAMLEIDTCPMEGFSNVQYDTILGLDKYDCSSVVVCPAGYRCTQDKYRHAAKIRYPREKIVIEI